MKPDFQRTILAMVLVSLPYYIGAEESPLPDQFSAPATQTPEMPAATKRPITASERKKLDEMIKKATSQNLPLGQAAFEDGEIQSNQHERLNKTANIGQNKGPQVAPGDEISPLPKFGLSKKYQEQNIAENSSDNAAEIDKDPMRTKALEIYTPNPKKTLMPGEPVTISVAIGRSNRIAFNFDELDIRTSNLDAPILKESGFLYITPLSQQPIGLMVGEAGIPESMVNVLLLPVDVPPVMANVDVVMTGKMKQKREEMLYQKLVKEEQAKKQLREVERELEMGESDIVKTSNPFIDRIANILTEVAREDIPKGFNLKLEHEIPASDLYPCDSTKLVMKHKTVQQLESSKEIIDIVKVTNDLSGLRSVEDEYCIKDGVYAAATFKRSHLLPGQSTEMYILRDKFYHKTRTQEAAKRRPRVID